MKNNNYLFIYSPYEDFDMSGGGYISSRFSSLKEVIEEIEDMSLNEDDFCGDHYKVFKVKEQPPVKIVIDEDYGDSHVFLKKKGKKK